MKRETILSKCKLYRYVLWRQWGKADSPYVLFIGLNPSTGDAVDDDAAVIARLRLQESGDDVGLSGRRERRPRGRNHDRAEQDSGGADRGAPPHTPPRS